MKKTIDGRRTFTLIELLIVIAIIAILASLLLPALNKARDRARTAQCATKMKALGNAFALYADAYAGFVPYMRDSAGEWHWPSNFINDAKLLDSRTFFCPGREKPATDYYFNYWRERTRTGIGKAESQYSEYGANLYVCVYTTSGGAPQASVRFNRIPKASQIVLSAESINGTRTQANSRVEGPYSTSNPVLWPVHSGERLANVLFVDGHVKGYLARVPGEFGSEDIYRTLTSKNWKWQ